MARALRFAQYGDPQKVIQLVDVPLPEGCEDWVLVRPTVEDFSVDQRVVPFAIDGSWKEFALVRQNNLIPIPKTVRDQIAAQLIINPVTAVVMLTKELHLAPGQWLLQTAAGSRRIILRLARSLDIKTINVVRRWDQIPELETLGADNVYTTADPDLIKNVHDVTRGGVHAVTDAVGGPVGSDAARCLRFGRTMLVYGVLSEHRTPINTGDLLFKVATIRGFWLTHWVATHPFNEVTSVIDYVLDLMTRGFINPQVGAEYDLGDFHAANAGSEQPGWSGKILLTG